MKSIRDLKHSRNTFMQKSLKAQERGLNDRNLKDSYFTSAVVKEYITNPVEYLNTEIFDTRENAENEKVKIKDFLIETNELIDTDLLDFMPSNSILAYPMTKRAGRASLEIFYPFFPPHLSFPAKAGEHVWVFYEVINRRKIGYWMCRKPTHRQVDDVNYTRAERINTIYPIDRVYREKQTLVKDEEINNLVTNGGPSNGLPDNVFHDDILRGSVSYSKDFLPEPVPNFPKKCGDLQLQGSNNATIVLGTEQFLDLDEENPHYSSNITKGKENSFLEDIRLGLDLLSQSEKGDLQIRNDSDSKFNNRRLSGAIDLAVGKGLVTYENTAPGELSKKMASFVIDPDSSRKISSSPELGVIKNHVETTANKKLEHLEIDKTRYLRGEEEADVGKLIDNKTDNCAARVYVSSISSPDSLWGRHLLPASVSRATVAYDEGSCAINYADHVRLYGNETIRLVVDADQGYASPSSFTGDNNTGLEINPSSVYLVGRYGSRIAFSSAGSVILQSSGGASIVLKSDGNVVITPGQGKNIKLGGESVDHQVLSNITVEEGPDGNIAKPIISTALGVIGDNTNDTRGGFVPNLLVTGFKQPVPNPTPNTSESDLECGVDETEFDAFGNPESLV